MLLVVLIITNYFEISQFELIKMENFEKNEYSSLA
jgi:hypothetical protein